MTSILMSIRIYLCLVYAVRRVLAFHFVFSTSLQCITLKHLDFYLFNISQYNSATTIIYLPTYDPHRVTPSPTRLTIFLVCTTETHTYDTHTLGAGRPLCAVRHDMERAQAHPEISNDGETARQRDSESTVERNQ